MIASLFSRTSARTHLLTSGLYNDKTFYPALLKDLGSCQRELLIESPFITSNRIASLLPIFTKMRSRGIKIVVNTRHPAEHEAPFDAYAEKAITSLQLIGVEVLYTGGHHRKLVVIDRRILWEGSLNVLSQNDSCEIMRRIDSEVLALQMLRFIRLDKILGDFNI